jgi:hypothetical protein
MKRLIVAVAVLGMVAATASAHGRRGGCGSSCGSCGSGCGPSMAYTVSYVEKEVTTYQCQLASKDVEVTYNEAKYTTKKGTREVQVPTWVKQKAQQTYCEPVMRKVEGYVTRCSYQRVTVCDPCSCCGTRTYCQPVTWQEKVTYNVCDYVTKTREVEVQVLKWETKKQEYEYQVCEWVPKKMTVKQYYTVTVPVKTKVMVPVYTPCMPAPCAPMAGPCGG